MPGQRRSGRDVYGFAGAAVWVWLQRADVGTRIRHRCLELGRESRNWRKLGRSRRTVGLSPNAGATSSLGGSTGTRALARSGAEKTSGCGDTDGDPDWLQRRVGVRRRASAVPQPLELDGADRRHRLQRDPQPRRRSAQERPESRRGSGRDRRRDRPRRRVRAWRRGLDRPDLRRHIPRELAAALQLRVLGRLRHRSAGAPLRLLRPNRQPHSPLCAPIPRNSSPNRIASPALSRNSRRSHRHCAPTAASPRGPGTALTLQTRSRPCTAPAWRPK